MEQFMIVPPYSKNEWARVECLKVAKAMFDGRGHHPSEVVSLAEKFADFVLRPSDYEMEQHINRKKGKCGPKPPPG